MSPPVTAFVGLGANLGDAAATVKAALDELAALPGTRLASSSRLYRTPAWGRRDQPDFVNAAARLETGLTADALLDALLAMERGFGRTRDDGARWGPRTLDLDLLLYGEARIARPGLCVPHPHLHQRAFVLVPLLEIAPDLVLPGAGPARDALAALEISGIEALEG